MLPSKLPKRLFKNKEIIHSYQHDRSDRSRIKHMSRDHIDVLQNIEFALVKQSRRDPSIDDRMIDEALGSSIKGTEPPDDADPRVASLVFALEQSRSFRKDVSDDLWIAGLRTVSESIRRHSSRLPGQTLYLDFVKDYVR